MAALIDAIDIKRKAYFELDNTPYYCLEADISTPTARGGQTLVRLKMRNLLTSAVFDKTFKAGDKFKEPDLQIVPASYLYSDGDGSHFLDQETYETLTLNEEMVGNALDFLIEGALIQLHKFNGNPIGLQLPTQVELDIVYTEPGVRGDTSSGSVTKIAKVANRYGDSRSALHQGRRKGKSLNRNRRVRWPRLSGRSPPGGSVGLQPYEKIICRKGLLGLGFCI